MHLAELGGWPKITERTSTHPHPEYYRCSIKRTHPSSKLYFYPYLLPLPYSDLPLNQKTALSHPFHTLGMIFALTSTLESCLSSTQPPPLPEHSPSESTFLMHTNYTSCPGHQTFWWHIFTESLLWATCMGGKGETSGHGRASLEPTV